MTKRLKLLYQDERPADAPDVVWMPDWADIELVTERIPCAIGYVDLDHGDVEVRPGTLDGDQIEDLIAEGRRRLGSVRSPR